MAGKRPAWRWAPGGQRLIAVDRGRSRIKLVLAELRAGGLRLEEAQVVDLEEEGLVKPEEIRRHLEGLRQRWGQCPWVVVLPPRLSFSQILDVPPPGTAADLPRLLEEQTARLRGLGQGPWLYEAVQLEPQGRWQQPWLLTVARLEDVHQHLEETTSRVTDVRCVSSAPRALVEAWRWARPGGGRAWLLDVGAAETLLVRVDRDRPVVALTETVGAEAWVDRLAAVRNCRRAEAEALLHAEDLFGGKLRSPELDAALREWWARVERTWAEARRSAPGSEETGDGELYVSGGATRWPGFLEALNRVSGRVWRRWPEGQTSKGPVDLGDFALAIGAAAHACQASEQEPSLLPPTLRAHARQLRQTATLLNLTVAFLLLVGLLLGVGIAHKAGRVAEKEALLREAESAKAALMELSLAARQRDLAFARYWPLWDQQERTLGCLETLRALETVRARHDFWSVLLADADSYGRGATWASSGTNGAMEQILAWLAEPPSTPSYVVELCVPAGGEATLRVLTDLVNDLRQDKMFSRVDSVPAAQRRSWVDPKVLIPDRHFVLAVDMVDGGWRALFQSVRVPEVRWGTNVIRRPSLWTVPRVRGVAAGAGPAASGASSP